MDQGFYATTIGRGLNTCFQVRPVIEELPPSIIDAFSKRFCGLCVPRSPGGISLRSMAIGTGRMSVSPAGARKASSSALPKHSSVTRIRSACFSTPPSCVRTSILPAPKKSRWSGNRAFFRPVRSPISSTPPRLRTLAGTGRHCRQGLRCRPLCRHDRGSGAKAVIPLRSNRLTPRHFDHHLYRDRNLVERFFVRIKHFRRIATRYDKLSTSILSFIHLACAYVRLA
jgi:transposase